MLECARAWAQKLFWPRLWAANFFVALFCAALYCALCMCLRVVLCCFVFKWMKISETGAERKEESEMMI